ncbi:MAG TPA: hypothetical protein VND93_28565 [Myxococcales bacterium]|nr:hypothetical protein [Myxococcales bacterium]
MSLVSGILNTVTSLISQDAGGASQAQATVGGAKVQVSDSEIKVDKGNVHVSISDKGVDVKVDKGEDAQADAPKPEAAPKSKAPEITFDKDTFEAARPPAPHLAIFDKDGGGGSKPGGIGSDGKGGLG